MGHKRYFSDSSDSSGYEEYLKGELVHLMKKRRKREEARRYKESSHRRSHHSHRHKPRTPSPFYSESSSSSVDSSDPKEPRRSRSRSRARDKRAHKSDDPAKADVPDEANAQVPDPTHATVKTPVEPTTTRAEVLMKLGKEVLEEKKYSNAVNELITRRWTGIVKKGLPEKEIADISALYPTPENNRLWDPPKLNPEVKATLNNPIVLRDTRIAEKQAKISACLAANAQLIEQIMKQEPSDLNNSLLEQLGDMGSMLADLQHDQSCIRKGLILAQIAVESTKKVLSEAEFGEYLFGDKLEDAVKSAKVLETTSAELRQSLNKNSSKQPKNSKGPPRRSNNQQRASSGGQPHCHRSSNNNRRGSPRHSSEEDHRSSHNSRRGSTRRSSEEEEEEEYNSYNKRNQHRHSRHKK